MTQNTSAGRLTIPIAKLGVMNQLGEVGIDGVEKRLQRLDNYNATVKSELVKSGYAEPETVGVQFGGDQRAGARVKLPSAPHGYALVLFPTYSANNAAALMLSDAVEDLSNVSEEMARSALTELAGIMASGFLDSWADTFEQRIDVSAATAVHNTEREIVGRTVAADDKLGIYITSRLRLPEHGVLAQVYLFPENETFVRILERVEVEMMSQ